MGKPDIHCLISKDLVSMPTSRKHEVPKMVQHSKNAVKNKRVHVPLIQQELLLMGMLLQKKVQKKELIMQ